ncbi:SUKH-4 family immunity protein [Mucilaginibacter sp. CSA2-8R]|uniref:SUKH-4 family immunity protein n=1 Tax=Mucilaginibacter sp. CSA2-8R TaxID=3141542 RepID=UPI00315D13BF
MTAQEYLSIWTSTGDQVSPNSRQKLTIFKFQPFTIDYLEVGLPKDAAPYLSFAGECDDVYARVTKLEDLYALCPERDKYIVIGSDESGNPIAINIQKNDLIEWLDHEDCFAPGYCNRSVECLLQFLIFYRDFINDIIECNGPEAYMDANFTDKQYDVMKNRMYMVDPDAFKKDRFWKGVLEELLVNRDYYQNQ